jgi:outer membrane biosynthesis protein TonB
MSFFRALFDFSFSEYITTKIIKFLYVVTIIIAALVWLGALIFSFTQKSALAVIGAIIFCPIAFILQVIFTRVGYEILIVVFGIAEHTRDMAWALTGGRKAPPTAPPAPPKPQPQYPQYPQQPAPPQTPPTPPVSQYPQYPPAPQPPQQPPAASQYPQYPQYPQPPQPGK